MNIQVDPSPLYELRIVVLMETAPQSNTYRQIILDQQQFLNMSQHLGKLVKKAEGDSSLDNYTVEFDEHTTYQLQPEIHSMKI